MRSIVWIFVAVAALVVLLVMGGCTKANKDVDGVATNAPGGVWQGSPADNPTDSADASVVEQDGQENAVNGVWGGSPAGEGADGTVHELSDASFEDEVLNATGFVVVDFNADWCGPCKSLKPVYHDLAAEFSGKAKFVSVNTDDCPQTAEANGVRGIPDIRIFKDGQQVDKKVGFGGKDDFRNWVVQNVK